MPVCPILDLSPNALARRCDPASLPFDTTAGAQRTEEFLGQDQAIAAVHFGIAVRRDGYNLFAVGPPGVGKQSVLRQLLSSKASDELPADDWCYVHNFDDPRRPRALRLPAGRAGALRADMERMVAELQVGMRAALEGEEYRTRRQKLVRELDDRQDKAFRAIEREAKDTGVSIAHEQVLFTVGPVRDGNAISSAEFDELSEPEQARLTEALTRAEDALGVMLQEFNDWQRQHREALQALERATAAAVGARVFGNLRSAYGDQPAVLKYLSEVEADLADSAEEFIQNEDSIPSEESTSQTPAPRKRWRALATETGDGSSFELRATVNVLIDHAGAQGAPVVYEDHPTYANLMGRIEYAAQFGSLIADFSLIKAGALHRARGGYLLLDAGRLVQNPLAWEALKRTLSSRQISMEAIGQQLDSMPTISLAPDPVPFADTKLVLLGERELYDLLAEQDPDFLELFKVLVDFDDRMDRLPESEIRYANLLAWLAFKDGLSDFTRSGVARLLEHSSRLAEDAGKLSVRMRPILDLMREADSWAGMASAQLISAEHVQSAIDAQLSRSGRLRERILEDVRHGITLIDSAGTKIGQVNGLSVVKSGEHYFGLTVRITARTWVGRGEVIDIEREVELGGPLHSKGVLILSGFLGARYACERPLSLSASLVFEQSYAAVEGDSASLAEACALLSALADMSVKQSLAVTGSMNQHGQVQAVGSINEKIEGFFDICSERGLTGSEGVLIPSSNARHLMLRSDIVAAVQADKFHVWTVDTLDDALQLLVGRAPGQRDERGRFPEGTINGAVDARLSKFAESSRHFLNDQRVRGRG